MRKPHSEETKQKISKAQRARTLNTGRSERDDVHYREWRDAVKQKYNNTCVKCGSDKNLHSHHVKSWELYPEIRYKVSNGILLCAKCHKKVEHLVIRMLFELIRNFDGVLDRLVFDAHEKFLLPELSVVGETTREFLIKSAHV